MTSLAGKRALVTGSTQGWVSPSRDGSRPPAATLSCTDWETRSYGRDSAANRNGVRRPEHVFVCGPEESSAIEQMMAMAHETFGSIDILINNAVVRHVAAIESMSPDDWDQDLAVNLSAAFHTIRLALPGMKTRNWGRIVNVSSIYGLVGATNRVGYVTTKTALIGLTRAVALETTGYDITCNAVCPGTSATPVHEASLATLRETQNLERDAAERVLLAGKQPTGRLIAPDGVAALIVSLCSPESRDITGAAIPIDGGWSAM